MFYYILVENLLNIDTFERDTGVLPSHDLITQIVLSAVRLSAMVGKSIPNFASLEVILSPGSNLSLNSLQAKGVL